MQLIKANYSFLLVSDHVSSWNSIGFAKVLDFELGLKLFLKLCNIVSIVARGNRDIVNID